MPDAMLVLPAELSPDPAAVPPKPRLQPYRNAWAALREDLLGTAPDTEGIVRTRAMLAHLCPTTDEQIRTLHNFMCVAPAAFRVLASECGWDPGLEVYGLSWDLAVIATVIRDTDLENH